MNLQKVIISKWVRVDWVMSFGKILVNYNLIVKKKNKTKRVESWVGNCRGKLGEKLVLYCNSAVEKVRFSRIYRYIHVQFKFNPSLFGPALNFKGPFIDTLVWGLEKFQFWYVKTFLTPPFNTLFFDPRFSIGLPKLFFDPPWKF